MSPVLTVEEKIFGALPELEVSARATVLHAPRSLTGAGHGLQGGSLTLEGTKMKRKAELFAGDKAMFRPTLECRKPKKTTQNRSIPDTRGCLFARVCGMRREHGRGENEPTLQQVILQAQGRSSAFGILQFKCMLFQINPYGRLRRIQQVTDRVRGQRQSQTFEEEYSYEPCEARLCSVSERKVAMSSSSSKSSTTAKSKANRGSLSKGWKPLWREQQRSSSHHCLASDSVLSLRVTKDSGKGICNRRKNDDHFLSRHRFCQPQRARGNFLVGGYHINQDERSHDSP